MELLRAELMVLSSHWFCSQSLYNYTAAQCIVIGPVCGCVTGGRCPNLTTASARARSVCVSLSAFFILFCVYLFQFYSFAFTAYGGD